MKKEHSPQEVNDVDTKPWAIHHTLGRKANQAAPGNHTHKGIDSPELDLGVESVTGTAVDNTDPKNPVVELPDATDEHPFKYIIDNTEPNGSYTLVLEDANGVIALEGEGSGSFLVTIPLDSEVDFPLGTRIQFFQVGSAYIEPTGAVDFYFPDVGIHTRTSYTSILFTKFAANSWAITGDLNHTNSKATNVYDGDYVLLADGDDVIIELEAMPADYVGYDRTVVVYQNGLQLNFSDWSQTGPKEITVPGTVGTRVGDSFWVNYEFWRNDDE